MAERMKPPPVGHGIGVTEQVLGPTSGLRLERWTARLYNGNAMDEFVCAQQAVTNQSGWTPLVINGGLLPMDAVLPVPATPFVSYFHAGPTPNWEQQLRLRIRGVNQFGMEVEEITPVLKMADDPGTAPASWITYFWVSSIFALVRSVEYRLSGALAGDTIAVGSRFCPVYAPKRNDLPGPVDPILTGLPALSEILGMGPFDEDVGVDTVRHSVFNCGLGVPLRLRSHVPIVSANGYENEDGRYDVIGGTLVNLTTGHVMALAPIDGSKGQGGWHIGMSDDIPTWQGTSPWRGDANKVGIATNLSTVNGTFPVPLLPLRRIDANWGVLGGAKNTPTFDWQDDYEITLQFRSTWNRGGAYGEFPLTSADSRESWE